VSIAAVPAIFYEFSFNADPNQATIPPLWTDLSSRVQYGWTLERGRQYELDINEAALWKVELANTDGALDPGNTASPYAPNILPYRPCRIRVVLGNNLLPPDVASAGEWSPLAAGPAPANTGVTAFGNGIATIASVGASAYQGTRVWATTVPAATPGADLLDFAVPTVTAGQTYTFTAQTQATTSGQNPATYVAIGWVGTGGTVLSTTSGSPSTLTGGAGTWTQLTVTGTAPAGTVAALLRVVTTTTPSAPSTVWCDGLQLEARGYATRWQMPWAPGVNLLPRNIATGTETMAATDSASNWFYPNTGTVAQAVNLAAAPSGQTTALAWSAPAGSTSLYALYLGVNQAQTIGPVGDCVQVTPGQSYTTSMYLTRSGPDATVNMGVTMQFFNSAGVSVGTAGGGSTTVPTSGWVRATASGTAPAGAAWARPFLTFTTATITGTEVIKATGLQVEAAASASTWADPGPATFLFTGLVERFPRTWSDLNSTYGTSRLQCVDATAALSQLPLAAPFINEVLLMGPNFFYQLADAAGSTACADSAARRVSAPIENSPYGVGSLTLGSSVTSNTAGSAFTGTQGPVATFNNNPGSNPSQQPETFISLHKTTVTAGPPNSGPWTRMIAFRASAIPPSGGGYTIWNSSSVNNLPGSCSFSISNTTGALFVSYHDGAGAHLSYIGGSSICDGNWHLIGMSVNPTSGAGSVWLDGVQVSTGTGLSTPGFMPVDTVGAYAIPPLSIYQQGFVGDIAFATEFSFVLSSTQWSTLYNSWRSASTGESSGARYGRVLSWIGWTGPTSIASGSTQSMGPATDLTGLTPLDALNAIAATENGDSYVSASGVLTFSARSALYGVRTPQVVFGENLPSGNAGEWPTEIGSLDFDPAHLANITQVTQYGGSLYTGLDATSIRRYYSRLYQRTINTTSGAEAQDAANYLTGQLKDPKQRANVIRMHPSAIIGLFPVLAQVDKNVRMRLMKRPNGAPATQLDGFIQRIAWTCSPESDFYVEYQASPADLVNYWRIAAMHTTLASQANSGQNLAVINALPDAARNMLAQSMPTSLVLWFEPGTSRFEAVTVQTVPTTVVGYSTATLTMAANLAFTHPAGSVVCEPLPTGYTDPTGWDSSSVLAGSYAQILSGGASGTNSVTVGPLVDSARNSFGQTWNTGDTVVVSQGGAAVETAVIQSVSTTYPGYTSATITFTANLITNHAVGDYVSDAYPSTATLPTSAAPTTRLTY
jgi:hypothetical protein